ncbi:hypothetical protein RZN05_02665 [Sphingomonas sp. HF-S4]|uniref:Uncharacterized protein n=1 Tax=Sphingomonas agrestis TaxID=3080540 RepID=A0ABU3Y3V8_9SPHN|nr:hypothetical protein [Sphingomonas sp. HF-S4]MDV3455872.1 hypothetical protein [Sphingomonas sp. HF-S4]
MTNKPNDWRKALIEATTGPMIAILFWFTMIVVVTLALGHGKAFDANVFEAFGAIGQVAIAAALLWLGYQQYNFTKELGERQRRLDMHDRRAKMVAEYGHWSDKHLLPLAPELDISTLLSLTLRSKALFSRAVINDLAKLVEDYTRAETLRGTVETLKNMQDVMAFMTVQREHDGVRQEMRATDERVRVRMLLEIDAAPDAAPLDLVFSDDARPKDERA